MVVWIDMLCILSFPEEMSNIGQIRELRMKRNKNHFLGCFHVLSIVNSATVNTGVYAAAAAKSLQSCPTLCDPRDGSPLGSPVPGILQARTLEWVAISFSNAWKWKWSRSVVSDPQRLLGLQPSRLLCPWDFPGKSTRVGCHCLLYNAIYNTQDTKAT